MKAEPFRRVFYHRPEKPVVDLLREVGVPASKAWELSVCPSPRTDDAPICTAGLAQMTLEELGVVFGSIVSVRRRTAGDCASPRARRDNYPPFTLDLRHGTVVFSALISAFSAPLR